MLNKDLFNIYIGVYKDKLYNSEMTIKQINTLKSKYELDIFVGKYCPDLSWDEIYDSKNEKERLLNRLIKDRELRVDKNQNLENPPLYVVFSLDRYGKLVRMHKFGANEETQIYKSVDLLP